jgi:TPR repeat protein
MPEFAEEDLRRFYGYPKDMTYDQYAKQEKDRARSLLESDIDAAVEILIKMTNSVKGDSEACMLLGDIFSDGKYTAKDPWKAMLYYVSALTDEGDKKSQAIWEKLIALRTMLLSSRTLGKLVMNRQDAEYACCGTMRQYMLNGSTSISNDDPKETEFSMTMSKADFKKYLGKEKHEVMGSPTPGTVTPMDLKQCPFCKAPLTLTDRSPEWDQLIRNFF